MPGENHHNGLRTVPATDRRLEDQRQWLGGRADHQLHQDGKVEGTLFGNEMLGSYDEKTRSLSVLEMETHGR
jgi:hypothetical protein